MPSAESQSGNRPSELVAALPELVERAVALVERGGRSILGITGPPGAGKSTLAGRIVAELGPERAVLVPMDGFHLANVTLRAWGRRDRKGAWDTFDADGFVHLLRRLRDADELVVHAPTFDREIEESIGSAIPVLREIPLVVTEGNYLLSQRGSWCAAAPLLTECWYLELDERTRLQRLTERHIRHGKDPEQATAWASGTDQRNADLIREDRERADLVVSLLVS